MRKRTVLINSLNLNWGVTTLNVAKLHCVMTFRTLKHHSLLKIAQNNLNVETEKSDCPATHLKRKLDSDNKRLETCNAKINHLIMNKVN